jgi:hypothetical protein
MRTFRKIKYFTGSMVEKGLCFFEDGDTQVLYFDKAITGFFHTWGVANGETVAIVESQSGEIHLVDPAFVKFTYTDTTTESLNELLSFIEDEESRQRVIDIIYDMK